jgi:hypothetical protein
MKSPLSWNRKEPLLRVVIILACLFISSLLLLAYQFKLSIVDGVPREGLFWANVLVTLALGVFFQSVAILCNVRLRKHGGDRLP